MAIRKSERVPEKIFAIAMWVVSVVFAGFLIGLGNLVLGDLPRLDDNLMQEQFVDQAALAKLRGESAQYQPKLTEIEGKLDVARLAAEKAQKATENGQNTFDDWIATRTATTDRAQDPEVIARTRQLEALRADELKAQEEEQWFSHSSLEATDSLKKAHRAETERVERELGKADKALGALEKNAGSGGEAEKNRLMEEFDQALQGLQNGAMKPNPQLLEQMRNMDLKNLGDLPPEQLEQLRENLAKHGKCMGDCNGEGEGENWDDELLAGDGEKEGDKPGEGPGKGGVNRGPGHAPGVLGAVKDAVKTGEMAALEAKDLSRAAPGDLLELQDGEHQIDESGSRIAAGGNIDATGKGGDRVWKESLDPDEQRVLKRFFE